MTMELHVPGGRFGATRLCDRSPDIERKFM
jgi:hypothetical protein